MRICVFGAGAIGGFVAARLARVGGLDVSVVARGAQLQAIRDRGLRIVSPAGDVQVRVRATDRADELGPQDVVFIALKQHQLGAALPAIASLLGPSTTVVPPTTGLPYWYFHGLPGPHRDRQLEPWTRAARSGARSAPNARSAASTGSRPRSSSTTTAVCCAFRSANPTAARRRACRRWPTR